MPTTTSSHPTTPPVDALDVVELTDDHAHLDADRLPRSGNLLGCRTCGRTAQEHGRNLIHRFLRPRLPAGHRYLDQVPVGATVVLRPGGREPLVVQVAELGPAGASAADDLLWLRGARSDCFLLHPATVVGEGRCP